MATSTTPIAPNDIETYVEHGYADNNGVKIHYASLGSGPLIVMIHGFPDYWYTWRNQMVALAPHYQTVALDLRGYNLSDKPKGVENYAMTHLVGDVQAVIRHWTGQSHSCRPRLGWNNRLAVCDAPASNDRALDYSQPASSCGLARELAHNQEQQQNSEYALIFQQEGAHEHLTPERLSGWVKDPVARERYVEALRRSDIEAMLNYYKQNYPPPTLSRRLLSGDQSAGPVLQIHGLKDQFLLAATLNNTWEWLENTWTLLTIPDAEHFVQHDAADLVTRTILNWLKS